MSHVFVADLNGLAVGDEVVIAGDEGHHAVRVRRIRVGESVELVDGEGTRAGGDVSHVSVDSCTVHIHHLTYEPQTRPALTVIQALVKKDRSDQAMELMTEAGVDEVLPWSAARSQTSSLPPKWARIARESSKQARRARFPVISDVQGTPDVSAHIARTVSGGGLVLLCHESAVTPISQVLAAAQPQPPAVMIVVGPEGGLTSDELNAFTAAGAVPVVMGPSVMRAASAGAIAAAVVSAMTTRWDEGAAR